MRVPICTTSARRAVRRILRPGAPVHDATPPARLPTARGEFTLVAFRFPRAAPDEPAQEHVAVAMGDVRGARVLVRVHSSCLTGDILGSHKCDCGPQLAHALDRLAAEGRGVVLYLNQEGRGIGLYNKIRAYALQDEGANTVDANVRLGLPAEARDYAHAAAMLRHLGVRSVRLMTNNPLKVRALEAAGVPVVERLPHQVGETEHNRAYLRDKRDLMGHLLEA
jgi:GTP cyclohydrolase II